MTVLQRYFATEIIRAAIFVLVAFLALFAFFDMMGQLDSIGRGNYQLKHAFFYIVLSMPGYAYELMPIAALIGTIYVLAQMASKSEFTIMRVSSLSTTQAGFMLAKIGVVFAIATFVFGEYVAPQASELAEKIKQEARGGNLGSEFRSGLWAKDTLRADGVTGAVIGSRFMNVGVVRPDGQLQIVRMYEFDQNFHMRRLLEAAHADYIGNNRWRLSDVAVTEFPEKIETASNVSVIKHDTLELVSEITPGILAVLFADPDRMKAQDLAVYARHLAENKQSSERYEIALWKKLTYPFAVFVMMALALPFAYLHFRSGGVSLKIFAGIMIGVSFQLLNRLAEHLGLLHTWPPFASAILPSVLFLLLAIAALKWVERH